ncbi:ATP-dependent DNA helicase RecQ [Brevibacterium sp. HMSC063G07]|uniref:RecQ family ATP-dependent DNA helicase n=1 Tax=Brevibacterium sp. HMSC063G07 TaxID=1739261 RepID=UPI0008A1D872|nr:RecQ family ATP-dependent DNA helicase [Brevibacterium sp. HMSC063G07]OFL68004.1 recombinase RecQ [Brevibacterium sp. HMSC063G07]
MSRENTLHASAQSILAQLTGRPDAVFRDGQLQAIDTLVRDRRRALVVQRTGWGKSAVYFVSARLIRQAGGGPTLVISPLLALMRDQVEAAHRAGVSAVTINSSNVTEWDDAVDALRQDRVDVLFISPERLTNPRFRDHVLGEVLKRVGMIVVDEAHCISDWGHDFRPDYRRIGALVRSLPDSVPVLATTATANERVVADVAAQLGEDTVVVRGPLTRDSLRLGAAGVWSAEDRIAWLCQHMGDFPGSGIVYTLTVSAAEDLARALKQAGWNVEAYTGGTDAEERTRLEDALKNSELKALVATSALGMGFDKPDLGFVVHFGAPASPVAYYQQVGRAGRAVEHADVLLLPGREDRAIWDYFATASMPDPEAAERVLQVLASADGPMSVPALEPLVDVKRSALELLLKTLQADGAVERVQGGYVSTGVGWTYDAERYAGVAAAREREARAMEQYLATDDCRMVFLARQLDDTTAEPCGRCDNCAGTWWSENIDQGLRDSAQSLLSAVGLPVAPRAQWPTGMPKAGIDIKGKIPEGERAETGRVIARLTDLGAGQTLRQFLAPAADDEQIPKPIGDLAVSVLADWDWAVRPDCVVGIPSTHRPNSAQSLAQGLAAVGRMEYLGQLELLHDPGSPDVNSAYRVKNLWDALRASPQLEAAVAGRTVLLTDLEIASRWTMTIAARLLRQAGAAAVLPFALAQRG